MNYQSIGSGGGIAQIKAKTVDFGASDMPLKPEDLQAAGLDAVSGDHRRRRAGREPRRHRARRSCKFTGPVLADIYLGKIKKWNDKAIADLNPGVKLPADPITVVRRSDGSGTTFIWTDYLSKVSPEWKTKVGASTAVAWPEGVGGKGNEGVAAYVQRIKGSIGYVEYAYAQAEQDDATRRCRTRTASSCSPTTTAFQAAAADADWKNAPGFYQILTDQPGKTSWPITGASFILMHTKQDKPQNAAEVLKFFDWAFKNGQKMADELDYVPLPETRGRSRSPTPGRRRSRTRPARPSGTDRALAVGVARRFAIAAHAGRATLARGRRVHLEDAIMAAIASRCHCPCPMTVPRERATQSATRRRRSARPPARWQDCAVRAHDAVLRAVRARAAARRSSSRWLSRRVPALAEVRPRRSSSPTSGTRSRASSARSRRSTARW